MKYRELINYLKEEPPVYHESSKAFWDDEHISKSMLDAHLNTENDGASRRLSTIQNSVNGLSAIVKTVRVNSFWIWGVDLVFIPNCYMIRDFQLQELISPNVP